MESYLQLRTDSLTPNIISAVNLWASKVHPWLSVIRLEPIGCPMCC